MSPSLALACAALLVTCGCRREAGASYRCDCSFLTDFDDAAKAVVEVCAPSAERAPSVARGCAQSAAPAPIQSCECRLISSAACAAGACKLE